MATRSAIGIQYGSTVKAVYCHNDGYPEGVGRTLVEHYNRVKTAHLISLGNLSVLGTMIEPDPEFPHSFNDRQRNVCVFYGRDRGEEGNEYQVFDSAEQFRQEFGTGIEYLYLQTHDGLWCVAEEGSTGPWRLVEDLLVQEAV